MKTFDRCVGGCQPVLTHFSRPWRKVSGRTVSEGPTQSIA